MSAPISAVIRLWRIATPDMLLDLDSVPADREMFQRGGLKLLRENAPVLVDHDRDREIGYIRELSEFEDTDGAWLWAHTTITNPPGWLRRGTSASISYASLHRCSLSADHQIVRRGLVTEVSVLSPSVKPEEPLARVAWVGPPTTRTPEPVTGEVIHGGATLRRPGIGRVVAVY